MQLTAEHIRYARPQQLAALTGKDPSTFSRWSHTLLMRGQTQQELADLLGMDVIELIKGFQLRRSDALEAKRYQAQIDELITTETASVGAAES